MKTNKKLLYLILGGIFVFPVIASAQVQLPQMVINIENAAITIGTSLVVIGWIIAGILYLTAAGSPEKTGTAKKAMIAAIIGTVLVVLAKVALATICQLLSAGQCT